MEILQIVHFDWGKSKAHDWWDGMPLGTTTESATCINKINDTLILLW